MLQFSLLPTDNSTSVVKLNVDFGSSTLLDLWLVHGLVSYVHVTWLAKHFCNSCSVDYLHYNTTRMIFWWKTGSESAFSSVMCWRQWRSCIPSENSLYSLLLIPCTWYYKKSHDDLKTIWYTPCFNFRWFRGGRETILHFLCIILPAIFLLCYWHLMSL